MTRILMLSIALLLPIATVVEGQITIPSTAGPWDPLLNPTFDYGVHDNSAPVVIDASQGISFATGATITITYKSGLVSASGSGPGAPFVDANGDPRNPGNGSNVYGKFPGSYITQLTYFSELVGTFAHDGVIVGNPFAVGDGPTTLRVPAGANQLLLGVNDNFASDDAGAFTVDVTGSCQVNQEDVIPQAGGTSSLDGRPTAMTAQFVPRDSDGVPVGLVAKAAACGYDGFNWQQWIEIWPAPTDTSSCFTSPEHCLIAISNPTAALSAPPRFLDPVPGGYTYQLPAGDDSYPFYFSQAELALPDVQTTTALYFSDTPAYPVLPSGQYMEFRTDLVGVIANAPGPVLFEWFWDSDFNGTSGALLRQKTCDKLIQAAEPVVYV